jgi:Flp pilus assembly protein TadD
MRLVVLLIRAVLAAALLLAGPTLRAADDPVPPRGDRLSGARALIAGGQWAAAIDELKKVNDTRSADWHNLMGYSQRKLPSPDLAAAERHYDEALRIDPRHRGALEYAGELHLMKGELPKAEARLAALGQACRSTCEEYRDLKDAIDRYKANGNRYQAR